MDSVARQGKIAVIGAGASGLVAARELVAQGHEVTLYERETVVGGRCATCPYGTARFDHGSQFFTVRDPDFELEVDQWIAGKLVRQWTTGFPQTSGVVERQAHPRYCGKGGMSALMEALAAGLDVRYSTPVKRIKYQPRKWHVYLDSLNSDLFDGVIMTPPVPEALAILDSDDIMSMGALLDPLRFVNYEPHFVVLAQLQGESGLPKPGAMRVDDGVISLITDNFMKGVSKVQGAVTILADPLFSEKHLEADLDTVGHKLIEQAAPLLKTPVENWRPVFWRYGIASNVLPKRSLLIDNAAPLLFSGDAFGASRLEGAILSGLDAAKRMGDKLKTQPEFPPLKHRTYMKRD